MITALVFGAILFTVLGALSSFVLTENKLQLNSTSGSRGLAIAEAGIEYYRWFLAHNPTDLQNGTGQPGPYTIPYNDPEGGQTGTISLAITGNISCGQTTSIDIRSTGTPIESPTTDRTIVARYARPTVALYSTISNSSVWAGEDRVISGPYHSNGGIRMDGTANAPVTSSLSTWLCDSAFKCTPSQTKTGVWGAGTNQSLWKYPVPQIDFAGIAADFTNLKTIATASGLYFPRFSSGTDEDSNYWNGYHIIFNGNGTITVLRVSATTSLPTNSNINATNRRDRTLIETETLLGTYTLPASCGLIFVEDNVWVEGVVDSKVTLVAANVVTTGVAPNAMLPNNITYAATDGTDGLTLIAENNVLISANSPTNMTLSGIFVAQGGAFGRNRYSCAGGYEAKNTLTIFGTIVSNLRTGTKWPGGCSGGGDAGYQSRIEAFDRKLSTDPPPFTPYTSTDYQIVDWRQE